MTGAAPGVDLRRGIESLPATRQWQLVVLTFTTGVVDAVGYLALDRVFTGNMTGNVVILGMALLGADGLPVLGPTVALVGFLVGAFIGGRCLRLPRRPVGVDGLLVITGALVLALAAVLAWLPDTRPTLMSVTGALGVAMGLQAATARHVGIKELSSVVVTSTLTGLAADSWRGDGTARRVLPRGSAVILLLLGGCVGALCLRGSVWLGLAVAGVLILAAVLLPRVAGTTPRRARAGTADPAPLIAAQPNERSRG